MSFDSYRKAQLHLQETRKTITIPQLDKDTCISYFNKVFQELVREDLHKLWTNKKKKTESEILSNYCQQQERKRTIPNLYKKTVELYNQENSTDFSKDTITATVDSKAIPYVHLYKDFVNNNAANILEELKNNDNNDNNNNNNNNNNNQDYEDNFIHNTITSQLNTILRPDLSDLEKNIIRQSLLKSQKIITNIMADISTLVLLDLLKRTTGPPVEITSILPECKITKVLPPPQISPPSYDVKKLMASHNNATKAERRLFELYTFGHLMHLLTATHNSQETSLTDTPGPFYFFKS
ncbi:uncharacterized protein BX664DRAFT_316841 [Halteromyces radiatus]|uniref:uncharacterized protein n=1 Tax=Halteromyces radiatus TaxID=101107 RepID=UPI00221FE13A|nr:uncharacterized protein BX664DRAFT_316841 [Halteromyces radiatus]KAI8082826.1 hypothetical protein BX664DRAFT_316841 [Halteromyces radiatus]